MTEETLSDADLFAALPNLRIDRDNIEHYRGLLAGKLLINRCQKCSYWIYPHRPICPQCLSWGVKPTEVSGRGSLYMYTLIQHSRDPNNRMAAPLAVAAVALAEQPGLRYLSTLVGVDTDEIKYDMKLRLTWIERDGLKTPAFEPDREPR